MPPSKSRAQTEDSKNDEAIGTKDKPKTAASGTTGRSRKTAASQANGSSLKKVMTPPVKTPIVNGDAGSSNEPSGVRIRTTRIDPMEWLHIRMTGIG